MYEKQCKVKNNCMLTFELGNITCKIKNISEEIKNTCI